MYCMGKEQKKRKTSLFRFGIGWVSQDIYSYGSHFFRFLEYRRTPCNTRKVVKVPSSMKYMALLSPLPPGNLALSLDNNDQLKLFG